MHGVRKQASKQYIGGLGANEIKRKRASPNWLKTSPNSSESDQTAPNFESKSLVRAMSVQLKKCFKAARIARGLPLLASLRVCVHLKF